jgi:hypothetical protein
MSETMRISREHFGHRTGSASQTVLRALFGKLRLDSPPLYHCGRCSKEERRSFSPLAELLPGINSIPRPTLRRVGFSKAGNCRRAFSVIKSR